MYFRVFRKLTFHGLISFLAVSIALPSFIFIQTPQQVFAVGNENSYREKTYYELLGLKVEGRIKDGRPDFTDEEIRQALRKKLRSIGDTYEGYKDKNLQELRRQVIEAGKVLRNSKLREQYDSAWDFGTGRRHTGNTVITDPNRLIKGHVFNRYDELRMQFMHQAKTFLPEMLVFMMLSTATGAGFALLEGDTDKAVLLFEQLGDIGSWLGFGTFAGTQGMSSYTLGVFLGSLISASGIGHISTTIGMMGDHLFRNVWQSDELRKAGINFTEMREAERNRAAAYRRYINTMHICGEGNSSDLCTKELPLLKEDFKQKDVTYEKYQNRFWTFHGETWAKLKMAPKEKEQFAQDATFLIVSGVLTAQIMGANKFISAKLLKPLFKTMWDLAKGIPKQNLPRVIYKDVASAAGSSGRASRAAKTVVEAANWFVKDGYGKIIWSATSRGFPKQLLNYFKMGLKYGVGRIPHLAMFLTVMEVAGVTWVDVSKTVQLRGVAFWPTDLNLYGNNVTGNNDKMVLNNATKFLAQPTYMNFYGLDSSLSNYADDWLQWSDKIIFAKANEIYATYEGMLSIDRAQGIKQKLFFFWILDSLQKYGRFEALDPNDPTFKRNDEEGFKDWHGDVDSVQLKKELYDPKFGYYTLFRKDYLYRFMKNDRILTGAELVNKIAQIKDEYSEQLLGKLQKRETELQDKMIRIDLPRILGDAFYGSKNSVRLAAWIEIDKLKSIRQGMLEELAPLRSYCGNKYFVRPENVCGIWKATKKREEIITDQIETLERESSLTITQRIKNTLGLDPDAPFYKFKNPFRPFLVTKYNYVDSLDMQYKTFRDLFGRIALTPTPYSKILTEAVSKCPQLKTDVNVSVTTTCLYGLAESLRKLAFIGADITFSTRDVTIPEEFKKFDTEFSSVDTAIGKVKVNSKVDTFTATAASDVVANRFARIFSGIVTEYILLPVKERRMSQIALTPIPLEEFYVDPFEENNTLLGFFKDEYFVRSRDIRNASNVIERESFTQPFDHMVANFSGEKIKVTVADLEELLSDEFASVLEWRPVKPVNPYYEDAVRAVEFSAAVNRGNLDVFKEYLKVKLPSDRVFRMVVTRIPNHNIQKLGLQAGDIIELVDTIQDTTLNEENGEMATNAITRDVLKVWIENIKKHKFSTASMSVMRADKGFDVARWRNFQTHNGRAGTLSATFLLYDVSGHPNQK